MPVFSQRWRDRAAALGITTTRKQPPRVVTFPEAVTLAAILTDLDWRRTVALDWNDRPYYQRIAESIGERSYPRWLLANNPVRWWNPIPPRQVRAAPPPALGQATSRKPTLQMRDHDR